MHTKPAGETSCHDPSDIAQRAAHGGLARFVRELRWQGARPPSQDRILGNLCVAAAEVLHEEARKPDKPFTRLVSDFVGWRSTASPSEQVGIFRSAAQDFVLPDLEALARLKDVEACKTLWHTIHTSVDGSYSALGSKFLYHAVASKVQTTVYKRNRHVEVLGQLGGLTSVLDVGCGSMVGTNWLAVKNSFQEVFGAEKVRVMSRNASGELEEHAALMNGYNTLLNRPSLWNVIRGTDLFDVRDPNVRAWTLSSLRPEAELLNPDFMSRMQALNKVHLPNVGFEPGDFSRDDLMVDFDSRFAGEQYDAVVFSTVFHQLPSEIRAAMSRRAIEKYLKPGGKLIYQDFAHKRKGELAFYSRWHIPYRYRTYVYDTAFPELGVQELFLSSDSRCEEIRVGRGLYVKDGVPAPVSQLILAA